MSQGTLKIELSSTNGWQVVKFSGRFDALTADKARDAILSALSAQTPKVAVDAAGVEYISSAGVRSLIVGMKSAAHLKDGTFAIIHPSPMVRRVIEESGLADCLGMEKRVQG